MSSIQFVLDFWNCFNFAKPVNTHPVSTIVLKMVIHSFRRGRIPQTSHAVLLDESDNNNPVA